MEHHSQGKSKKKLHRILKMLILIFPINGEPMVLKQMPSQFENKNHKAVSLFSSLYQNKFQMNQSTSQLEQWTKDLKRCSREEKAHIANFNKCMKKTLY